MQISEKALEEIKDNNRVKGALVAAFDRHYKTIEEWIKNGNILLTTPTAVEIIKKETGLTEKEILAPDKVPA